MPSPLAQSAPPYLDRAILHVDANCFYAGVEMFRRPELRGTAMCVGGEERLRHGIVLAKSPLAKAAGVKTGEALWQARRKCPGLAVVPPNFGDYIAFSHDLRELFYTYTDRVEPFGLDECWLDLTDTPCLAGTTARLVAEEISERVKEELGISVSVGVSWNKPFAKLGSDADPGDGVVEITPDDAERTVWELPAADLLNVGPSTERRLAAWGIRTIGDIARADPRELEALLGKPGRYLWIEARGEDASPVAAFDPDLRDIPRDVKSVGNGLTAPHDIVCARDAKALLWRLAESVAQRLRSLGAQGRTVAVAVRRADLSGYERQRTLPEPTSITAEVARAAWSLLESSEPLDQAHPLRALYVRVSGLSPAARAQQADLFGRVERRESLERLDRAVDALRSRFGNGCVARLCELADPSLDGLDPLRDNTVHPRGYYGGRP